MYELVRKEDDINAQLNTAFAWERRGGSSMPGMTYEQGVLAGIRWLIGEVQDLPIEEEPDED